MRSARRLESHNLHVTGMVCEDESVKSVHAPMLESGGPGNYLPLILPHTSPHERRRQADMRLMVG